ncbi:MAG TPA: IcfG-like protein, partial [Odoribacter splanchnicus]|nr:IcfG-like protein [Odoribacter splanchnicus]
MATLFPYSHIFDKLHRFTWIIILSSVLFLALLVIICTTTVRKITRPLKIFAASTHSIAEGNFNITLPVIHTQDEMLDLYNAFSEMQEKLSKYMKNLETTIAAKEKIESELRIAHDIQMSMLPKNFPPFPGHEIDLYAVLYPARQVGGDLYDFFIHENTLFFAIGDVSGKGIPASLLMASTISLLRTLSSGSNSPSQIAYSLNNSIAERNEADMFVTFFIGMLDLRTGVMKYCNAGHTPPVLTSPD